MLYTMIMLTNIAAYLQVHHPALQEHILQIDASDIFYNEMSDEYFKIEKHYFSIKNPYRMIGVDPKDANLNLTRRSKYQIRILT